MEGAQGVEHGVCVCVCVFYEVCEDGDRMFGRVLWPGWCHPQLNSAAQRDRSWYLACLLAWLVSSALRCCLKRSEL